MSIPSQLGDDGQDLETTSTIVQDSTTKEQEDIVMTEGEGDSQQQPQQQQQQLPLESSQSKCKIGFHRYLSAEYIDT